MAEPAAAEPKKPAFSSKLSGMKFMQRAAERKNLHQASQQRDGQVRKTLVGPGGAA